MNNTATVETLKDYFNEHILKYVKKYSYKFKRPGLTKHKFYALLTKDATELISLADKYINVNYIKTPTLQYAGCFTHNLTVTY